MEPTLSLMNLPYDKFVLSFLTIAWTTVLQAQTTVTGTINDADTRNYFGLKKYKEASHEYELALALNYDTHNLSLLGLTYGLMGEKLKAMEVIEKMKKHRRLNSRETITILVMYMQE